MKQIMILASALMLCVQLCLAQNANDYYAFRAYNQSLVLLDGDDITGGKLVLSDYGTTVNSTSSALDLMNYRYQGQEYSKNLGLYLYPFRIFSTTTKRFYQPDPKSQYHSPYLFVGADPINYIDRDGLMGKPLFLYQEMADKTDALSLGVEDVGNEIDNAYRYPMSDFINGKIEALPEFNGNVFLFGHMSPDAGKEIGVEEAYHADDFKVKGKFSSVVQGDRGIKTGTIDGEEFGRRLRAFSEKSPVPVKSVVAGGCRGEYAAESMSRGFFGRPASESTGTRDIQFAGFSDDNFVTVYGKKSTPKGYDIMPDRTRFYLSEEGEKTKIRSEKHSNGKKEFVNMLGEDEYGASYALPYIEGNEINEMANGRIPEDFEDSFRVIRGVY